MRRFEALRRRIGELDPLARQLGQSGLDNARAQLLPSRKRAELEDFINRGQRCQHRSDGTTTTRTTPPWIKALAEVRIQATREGWCHAHVQAIIVAIDQYAEAALGNRVIFSTSRMGLGGQEQNVAP